MTRIEELTYIGRRMVVGGAVYPFYMREDGTTFGTKKALMPASIGAVISREVEDDDTYYTSGPKGPKFVRHGGDERRFEWEVQEAADVALNKNRARAKKGDDPLLDSLAPLRAAMQGMSYDNRAALIAHVIAYLTK